MGLLPRIPANIAFRRWGWPRLRPLNVVVSLTYRCNSRCRTCNVWRRPRADELSLAEWERVFAGLGPAPVYLTFSGGEPFIRPDLADIVATGYRLCRPAVITIPTNGLLPDRVLTQTVAILEAAPKAQVGINLSLDGVGKQHDDIRGVPGAWDRAMQTYRALRELERPNLVLGIHTVVSRFNVADLPTIYEELAALEPDSYITEVAEERVELGTVGAAITPTPDEYDRAAAFLIEQLRRRLPQDQGVRGLARVTRAFRVQYYGLAARILREQRQVIPCYAGWSSAHVAPDGDVWTCCTRAEPIGNLRETDFDFDAIWFGDQAAALRRSIRAGECACPMANVSYTNMLLHPPTLARVACGRMVG